MQLDRTIDRFGPLTLDRPQQRLTRAGARVLLPRTQMGVLLELTKEPGEVVSHDALIEAGWGQKVGNDALRKVIAALNKACGPLPDGAPAIATVARYGYKWMAPLDPPALGIPDVDLQAALLEPDDRVEALVVSGRRGLETLVHERVLQARQQFTAVLASATPLPEAHAGLAATFFLLFQATRADDTPDYALLRRAGQHALAAWRQAPNSGIAWAMVALVRSCAGFADEAVSAAVRAVARNEGDWLFQLVLAYVSTGGRRLAAATRALELTPKNPIAHWLCSTTFVARQALLETFDHLRTGCALQDLQRVHGADAVPLPGAGLFLLHGQVLNALGDRLAALEQYRCELACDGLGHIFGREASANSYYCAGVDSWLQFHPVEARRNLREAKRLVPGHRLAGLLLDRLDGMSGPNALERWERLEPRDGLIGLEVMTGDAAPGGNRAETSGQGPAIVEGALIMNAIVRAAAFVIDHQHAEAARTITEALRACRLRLPGAAWSIPIEPILVSSINAYPELWTEPLALLHARAL